LNNSEYKKAFCDIVPSDELIKDTLLKIKKQKRSKAIKISTCFQIAAAACFCVVVKIVVSNISDSNGSTIGLAGSVFGKGTAWVFAGLLFALITTAIVIINKRRK